MVMRLPSRFMATRSGTVTFFGAGVDVPPYWSLMSNLRPGRLRAGPGVNAIVLLTCISQDSFQITDGWQQETGERQRDRDRTCDDENERRALGLGQDRRADRRERHQQGPSEVVDASDSTEESSRHVYLKCRDPQNSEAREAEPLDRAR